MRKRVLYASFDVVPSPKGASTHILHFAEALGRRHDVELLTLHGPGLEARGEVAGCPCTRVAVGGGTLLGRVESFRRQLLEKVEGEAYDVIHFRSIWAGFPLVRRRGGGPVKLVYEANGFPSLELVHHYPFLVRQKGLLKKLRMQELATMIGADRIITPSAVTAGYMDRQGIHASKIAVVQNGVDTELFRASPLPDPAAAPLLYMGTLAPWQGLGILFSALKKVSRERPVHLRILGSGKKAWKRHYRNLARQARVHRLITWCDPVHHDRVPDEIAASYLCLAPLTKDPRNTVQGCCPIKIVEYMACARPVVAADLPVVRELATDGQEALLHKAESVNGLTAAILRLLNDPAQARRLATAARTRAEQLTWERSKSSLLSLYDTLLTQ